MIKFFRKIRQNLLSEGKTGKYIKYAIGEIVLVMIGILLALQVNNWNEGQKRLKQETILLGQLKEEIINNYDDLISDLTVLKQAEISHFKIIDWIEQDLPYNDSLCFDFYWLKIDEYMYPITAVYDKIREEGLDIIRNDTIRVLTQSLYESLFPRLRQAGSFYPDISEYLGPYYLDNFRVNTDYNLKFSYITKKDSIGGIIFNEEVSHYPGSFNLNGIERKYTVGFVPLDYAMLKKDPKFRMQLNEIEEFRDHKISRYSTAKRVMKWIADLIEIE
ncbi:MAG: hypothetical protein DA407_15250 [Bacteroidetes bacterium]|nr:MAG: hypothetical protein DA407_15250 [Bacteroidota bacterium]